MTSGRRAVPAGYLGGMTSTNLMQNLPLVSVWMPVLFECGTHHRGGSREIHLMLKWMQRLHSSSLVAVRPEFIGSTHHRLLPSDVEAASGAVRASLSLFVEAASGEVRRSPATRSEHCQSAAVQFFGDHGVFVCTSLDVQDQHKTN